MLFGAFANPLVETPQTRTVAAPTVSNMTVNTANYNLGQQTTSLNAITAASLKINLFNTNCATVKNFFSNNYAFVGSQQTLVIQPALSVYIGVSLGVSTVSGALQNIINKLNAANLYLQAIDETAAQLIATKIAALVALQEQINAAMNSCATNLLAMYYTCPDSLYTLISQFCYQAGTIMGQITTKWCSDVSANPALCGITAITTTTTTSTSTTTTTVSMLKFF